MNKIQKIICKVFKIKTEVKAIYKNDPLAMLNSSSMSGADIDSVVNLLNVISRDSDIVQLGYETNAVEIRSLPLSSKEKTSLDETVIVIKIKQTAWS